MSSGRHFPRGAAAFGGVMLVAAVAIAVVALRGPSAPRSMGDRVRSVASTLRCPVCQNLSVADSPSRLAQQMRATIAQDLQAGRTPDQIRAEFTASYGDWILLAPPKHGIDLIAWVVPLILVAGALVAGLMTVRRWTSGQAGGSESWVVSDSAAVIIPESDRQLLDRALLAAAEEPD